MVRGAALLLSKGKMESAAEAYWHTDPELLAGLPGGPALIEWFGFVPEFHDATLDRLDLSGGSATLALKAFRTTGEVDANGYFIADRHAIVTIRLSGVSAIALTGDASAIVLELRIRRLSADGSGWPTCDGPKAGDFEVNIVSSYGLEGALFGRNLAFSFIICSKSAMGFA
jgi:hypothetical protein